MANSFRREEVAQRRNRVVYLLLKEPNLTTKEISERTGLSEYTVRGIAKKIMVKIAKEEALSLSRDSRFKKSKKELSQWGFHGVCK